MGTPLSILDYRQPVEFRIGEVITRSWNVLSRHFLTFILLVGIAELLPLVVTLYQDRIFGSGSPNDVSVLLVGVLLGLLQFVLISFAQATVVHAAFQDLRGRPVDALESFNQAVRCLIPVVVASVLVVLIIFVGFLFCVIPGLIAVAAMAVVMPACVVERLGPIASMSRSTDLTTGHRWPIIAVGAAWAVIILVVSLSIKVGMPAGSALPTQLLTWLWQVLSGSFTAVYAAILYHDLRAVREGIGIDEIASVFD